MTPVKPLKNLAQKVCFIFMNFYLFMEYYCSIRQPKVSTSMTDITTFLSWQDGLDFL